MKKLVIGLPCTPSLHVSNQPIILYKILVSYGGGMGGANRTYYCNQVEPGENGMIKIYPINDYPTDLNTRYIVTSQAIDAVKVVTNITGHLEAREGEQTCKTFEEEYFELKPGQGYAIQRHLFKSRSDGELKAQCIHSLNRKYKK